jgi:hypothetical protein
VEELNPEVVGVVGAREAEGEASAGADHVLQPFLVHGVDVEGRVGEDEVEASGGFVGVVVVAVHLAAVADVAFEAVDGEVHAAQAAGFVGLLDAVDGQFAGRVAAVGSAFTPKLRTLTPKLRTLTPRPSPKLRTLTPCPSPRGRGEWRTGGSFSARGGSSGGLMSPFSLWEKGGG